MIPTAQISVWAHPSKIYAHEAAISLDMSKIIDTVDFIRAQQEDIAALISGNYNLLELPKYLDFERFRRWCLLHIYPCDRFFRASSYSGINITRCEYVNTDDWKPKYHT